MIWKQELLKEDIRLLLLLDFL